MIYFLVIFILAMLQRTTERSCIAMTFLVVTFCFDLASQIIHEDFYCLVCAFGSWFTVVVLRSLSNHPLSLCLQVLCFVSVILNLLGYMLWIDYYAMTLYNQAFIIVSVGVVLVMLHWMRRENDGGWSGTYYNINTYSAEHSLRILNRK